MKLDQDGAPDPTKWTYEVGYIRNNEARYYTVGRKENTRVENGNLVIEVRKEQNFAVGGGWAGQQGIDESIFPQQFLIDYVRVYEKAEADKAD